MSIRAGTLREAVTIESPVEQTNAYGESTITWQTYGTRRASIDGLATNELIDAQQPYTVATHEVKFRYLPGLKTAMRLVWTSRSPHRTLDILSVSERNNREEHVMVCKEQVP